MKNLLQWALSAGVVATGAAAHAQTLLPMRGDVVEVVRVSDFGGPYAAMPREYGPPMRDGYGPGVRDGYAATVLPPREIGAILREAGFSPLGVPAQRGLVYTVSAIDRDGEDGRLVIDARSGRILRFMPAYRMGGRMDEETMSSYGPESALQPLPDTRRPPHGAPVAPKLASRTPAVPLPKAPPVRAVAAPARVAAPTVPVAVAPPAAAAAVTQQAVVAPKADEVRVIPMTPQAAEAPAAAPVVPAAPDAKAVAPSHDAPPVQGLE